MRVSAGQLDDLPTDHVVAVGDGEVVVVRSADGVCAYRNACLHKGLSLDGARVHAGRFACPQHFWQYDLGSGRHLGGRGSLTPCPVTVTEAGEVLVEAPEPAPAPSMRELLLAHARDWERGA